MKRYYISVIFVFLFLFLIMYSYPVRADLPLQGKVIAIDSGHGGLDPGSLYNDIYEKDITLSIGKYLEKYLSEMGATVIMTRTSDSDLSNGVKNHRKKADFDERIKIINQNIVDMYVSIHLNYLTDTKYYGAQVFYNKGNENLARDIQEYLNKNTNTDRNIKKIPPSTYMYGKLTTKGVLVECGFLSNAMERSKLVTKGYQSEFAKVLAEAISHHYN
mgnify:CR=1 FL=1